MSSYRSTLWALLGATVIVLGGLGLGFASSRFQSVPAATPPAPIGREWSGGWSLVATERPTEQPRGEPPQPRREGAAGKRALLIGVTKYDHLAESAHLGGPGNDARLMRTTLVERYKFPPENVVILTEDEGKPELRPTRANIAREFKRLADAARAGDQVVVLMAGHGDRQPESDPPDPVAPEPDGLDEIFLPADVKPWAGYPARVPNAIADKELRDWLAAITAKKAYVWAVFDCCHSGSMTRSTEVVRQLPTGVLVPDEDITKSRARAAKRTGQPAPQDGAKAQVLTAANEYLVATFACREFETTPESRMPAGSPKAQSHGLLTYSVVSALEQSASSVSPLTYRELMQRVQASYLTRPQGSPAPSMDGVGQDRVVLGTEKPIRPRITLTRVRDVPVVNVGDLHGVTRGSILRVYSPAGEKEKPRVLGYVRIDEMRPLESTVSAVEYEKMPKLAALPASALCEVVAVDYSLSGLRVGVEAGKPYSNELKKEVAAALRALPKEEVGLIQLEDDLARAEFVVWMGQEGPELQVASGKRPPIPLPPLDSEQFAPSLTTKLKAIHQARSLIAAGTRLQEERSRGTSGSDIKIEVLSHESKDDPGQAMQRPVTGWVFRTGDRVSFRVTNTSTTKRLEVTLLVVDPDYRVQLFYPGRNKINKALEPGGSFDTDAGTINEKPPFGPENLVAIVTSPTNPAVDYSLLTQPGVRGEKGRGAALHSPIAQLLDRGMNGNGVRSGLTVSEMENQGARVLNWRTEPTPKK